MKKGCRISIVNVVRRKEQLGEMKARINFDSEFLETMLLCHVKETPKLRPFFRNIQWEQIILSLCIFVKTCDLLGQEVASKPTFVLHDIHSASEAARLVSELSVEWDTD
jgi:hypothetical protein